MQPVGHLGAVNDRSGVEKTDGGSMAGRSCRHALPTGVQRQTRGGANALSRAVEQFVKRSCHHLLEMGFSSRITSTKITAYSGALAKATWSTNSASSE